MGDERRMFLLAISNNANPYTGLPPLKNAERDVSAVRDLFSRHPFHVPNDRMQTLRGRQATRDNISSAFHWLENQEVRPEDAVVIYFARHGQLFRLSELWKGQPGHVSAICPYDTLTEKDKEIRSISSREVNILLRPLSAKTKNVTVILDACYSSHGTRGPKQEDITAGLRSVLEYARATAIALGELPGVDLEHRPSNPLSLEWKGIMNHTLLAASAWDRKAFDGIKNGEFTNSLLRVLRSPRLATMSGKDVVRAVRNQIKPLLQVPRYDGDNASSVIFGGAFVPIAGPTMSDSHVPRQQTLTASSTVECKPNRALY